jgi:hypothetical protein
VSEVYPETPLSSPPTAGAAIIEAELRDRLTAAKAYRERADDARNALAYARGRFSDLACSLDRSAKATAPSRKSQIEADIATAIREALAVTEQPDTSGQQDNPVAAIAVAAERFTAAWRELLPGLPDSYECHLTCAEANAAADLFDALLDGDTAAAIIAAHVAHDSDQEAATHQDDPHVAPRQAGGSQ